MLANLHTLWMSNANILCVQCQGCKRRVTIEGGILDAHRGNMNQLRDLNLKCSRCGSKAVQMFMPKDYGTAQDFLRGVDIESVYPI
jgi:Zn finger protein HypA/HybF involved in hydrogenase expression